MLYLVKGRAGSGKTEFINTTVGSVIDSSSSGPLLIVPEQFSFESERKLLRFLGAERFNKMSIFSFSRLAFSILKDSFDLSNIPSAGVRLAMMHEAVLSLEGRLNIFSKSRPTLSSLSPLVEFCEELKYCNIGSEEILSGAQMLSDSFLKNKLTELNLINETYDALIKQSYFDDTEAVSVMNSIVLEKGYFKNKTVFIDGFREFSKQEAETFGIILSQADNVYVTLCTDKIVKKSSSFSFIRKFETMLRTIASNNNCVVEEVFCQQKENSFTPDIFHLEKALFNEQMDKKSLSGSINVVECSNSADECEYISKEIKRLLRTGEYRCRDIAVIERTGGVYKNRIVDKLRKLDIPVFDDSRRSLKFETLFVYVSSMLRCITTGFSIENIFTYLKSGLAGVDVEEISQLEKYALIWNISGGAWSDEFDMHPDGFGSEMRESDKARLNELNRIRHKVVAPLLKLRKDCIDKTGQEISALIYEFLCYQGVADRLYDFYVQLDKDGFSVEAARQSVSWDILMKLLDDMAMLYKERVVGIGSWVDKFLLLVDSGDVGEIPQGLDEVKIGSADRIRTEKLKVVFLVGVNKDEFPLVVVKGGVLSDSDRVSLTDLGIGIKPPFEQTLDEERFIAYCAVTAASEKLYLTYKTTADDGAPAFRSEIVETVVDSFDDVNVLKSRDVPVIDKIECEDDAFSVFAGNFRANNEINSTLRKYFSGNILFADRIAAIERAANKLPFTFKDNDVSKRLFQENIYLSASRIESYYNCPFSYFMRYGLKAEPLRVAELDSMQGGTIVHYVMENVLKKYPKATFVEVADEELRNYIGSLLEVYLDEKMGSSNNKTKRFMYLFNRLIDICMTVIDRLKQEFRVGAFEPHDFELKIGGDEIPPYTIELENGSIVVTGSVDRVDLMEKDGIKYIRVIDYKTGKKQFKLSELFSGINMQMVLYLMALEKNGGDYFGKVVPSGVLYLPSKIGIDKYMSVRSPSDEDIASTKRLGGKLSGMILNSPVVYNGMGVDVYPDYFPVGYNRAGELTGDNFTLSHFKSLSQVVDGRIRFMGESLHKGVVNAVPCGKDGSAGPCGYCSYRSACGFENGDEVNEICSMKHSGALERLEDEEFDK